MLVLIVEETQMRFAKPSVSSTLRRMLDLLERVDTMLIDKVFEPSVHRIAEAWRIDCFAQARVCTIISALVWIIPQARSIAAAAKSQFVALQYFQGAVLLLVLSAIMVLHTLFQRNGGSGAAAANPLRPSMFIHRITILLGLVMNIAQALLDLAPSPCLTLGLCVTASVYVGACSNIPPKPRRETEHDWGGRLAVQARRAN